MHDHTIGAMYVTDNIEFDVKLVTNLLFAMISSCCEESIPGSSSSHQESHVNARGSHLWESRKQTSNHHTSERHLQNILGSLVASCNNFSRLSCPIRVATFCTQKQYAL